MDTHKQITVLGKNQAVSEYLPKLSGKLNNDQLEILAEKYKEPQISKLNDAEILANTAKCLTRIHIITGWNLPNDQDYIKTLIEELCLKLKEDFYMLSFSEISFAFRKAVGKKDWGKNMNLELVCDVLSEYSHDRALASMEEEKINTPVEQKIYTDEEIINQRRGEIEQAFQAMKKGYYPLLHFYFKEVLEQDGLLQNETVGEFFVRNLNSGKENIYLKY